MFIHFSRSWLEIWSWIASFPDEINLHYIRKSIGIEIIIKILMAMEIESTFLIM